MGPCSEDSVPTICLHSSTQEWLCWVPEGSWADGKLFLLYCAELSENLQELMFFFLPGIQDLDFPSLPVDAEGCELCFLGAVWGLCKLLLFMYPCIYQIVYQKSISRNSPLSVTAWQLVLPAAAPALSHLPVPPTGLCRLGGLRGWWRGMGALQYLQPHLPLDSRQGALKS